MAEFHIRERENDVPHNGLVSTLLPTYTSAGSEVVLGCGSQEVPRHSRDRISRHTRLETNHSPDRAEWCTEIEYYPRAANVDMERVDWHERSPTLHYPSIDRRPICESASVSKETATVVEILREAGAEGLHVDELPQSLMTPADAIDVKNALKTSSDQGEAKLDKKWVAPFNLAFNMQLGYLP
ncbi:hypothetical protein C8T65DRAFT_695210 [Cerioporus squamosus]|nr:hypothetical protein C8T65DRAFT_695210 [Cerioporus squamosus]